MKRRLSTIFDDLFPDSLPEFAAIAHVWPDHVVVQMLTLVWDAFDRVRALPRFDELDFTKDYAQLERSLTDLHAIQVTLLFAQSTSDFESFVPHHEAWEFENLTQPSARPPSCEIGFVFRANPRIRWSVEAKVLQSPTNTHRYVDDLNKYLEGTGSPFSTQAALGAYLVSGKPDDVFAKLAQVLRQQIRPHAAFRERPHRVSQHQRDKLKLPTSTPSHFICHHLIFALT